MTTVGPVIVRRAIQSAGTKLPKGKRRLVVVQRTLSQQYGTPVAFTPAALDELTKYVGRPLRGNPRS